MFGFAPASKSNWTVSTCNSPKPQMRSLTCNDCKYKGSLQPLCQQLVTVQPAGAQPLAQGNSVTSTAIRWLCPVSNQHWHSKSLCVHDWFAHPPNL